MPSSPPAIVAAATEQPGPLLQGWGRDVWAEGPAPHPGLQGSSWGGPMTCPAATPIAGSLSCIPLAHAHGPHAALSGHFRLSLAQMAPPPGSPPAPAWVRCPLPAHAVSLGFPRRSPDFLGSPLPPPRQSRSESLCTGLAQQGPLLRRFPGPLPPQHAIRGLLLAGTHELTLGAGPLLGGVSW